MEIWPSNARKYWCWQFSANSLVRSVRCAYRADLAFLDVLVEPFDDRFDWGRRMVVVQQK